MRKSAAVSARSATAPADRGLLWSSLLAQDAALLDADQTQPGVFVRPCYVRLVRGNGNAALLLSQLVSWSRRTTDEEGWFYESMEELQAQVGLGPKTQRKARMSLVKLGVLETTRKGEGGRLRFRVDLPALARLLAERGGVSAEGEQIPEADREQSPSPDRAQRPTPSRETKIAAKSVAKRGSARRAQAAVVSLDSYRGTGDEPPPEKPSTGGKEVKARTARRTPEAGLKSQPRSPEALDFAKRYHDALARVFPQLPPKTADAVTNDAYWLDLLHVSGYGGRTYAWEELEALLRAVVNNQYWRRRIGTGRDLWKHFRAVVRDCSPAAKGEPEEDHAPPDDDGPSAFPPVGTRRGA